MSSLPRSRPAGTRLVGGCSRGLSTGAGGLLTGRERTGRQVGTSVPPRGGVAAAWRSGMTVEPPAPISLDDLSAPVFGPEAREVMGLGAALADTVELVPDRLVADAIAKAGGLDDFGPDGWQEPL